MRALIYDPDTAHGVRFDEIDEPRPQASQALIKVETASLNFGELAFAARQMRPGQVFGKDAAGVVGRPPPTARDRPRAHESPPSQAQVGGPSCVPSILRTWPLCPAVSISCSQCPARGRRDSPASGPPAGFCPRPPRAGDRGIRRCGTTRRATGRARGRARHRIGGATRTRCRTARAGRRGDPYRYGKTCRSRVRRARQRGWPTAQRGVRATPGRWPRPVHRVGISRSRPSSTSRKNG